MLTLLICSALWKMLYANGLFITSLITRQKQETGDLRKKLFLYDVCADSGKFDNN
jgi:hypothetical protein